MDIRQQAAMSGPLIPPPRLVLLPARMSLLVETLLEENFDVRRLYGPVPPEALLAACGKDVGVVAIGAAAGFPDHLWDRLPRLELIVVHGVGLDGVDLDRASTRGVEIRTTPDILSNDVADLAIGLWLTLSRRILYGDQFVRSGQWTTDTACPFTRSATGQRAGIVGLGRIGMAIARRLQVFGVSVAYTGKASKPGCPFPYEQTISALADGTDVLFVTASGGACTAPLITRRELDAIGPTGLLVNVARGSLIDEDALIDALDQGRLGGAGLDVFKNEPAIDPRFAALKNVVLQPHQGSATVETRRIMANILCDQIAAHFQSRGYL